MEIRPLGSRDGSFLQSLISRYPYYDYRAFSLMPADGGPRLLLEEFAAEREAIATGGVWAGRILVGAGVLERLPWDSKHFGLAMGRIGPLVTDPGCPPAEAIDPLVDWLLERADEAGLDHVATKVDSADIKTLQTLEVRGFRIMDCLVTYFHDARRDPRPPMKQLGHVRDCRPPDQEAVLAIAERMLGQYGGRFAFDPWLPREAVGRFYVEWTRNACAGLMADRVLVGERHGRIVGFLGYRLLARPSRVLGARIAGQGISAVLPEGTGLYPALLAKAIIIDRPTYDVAEFDTPIQNVLPQRVFQRMGFHLGRAKYTLHRGRP